MPPWNGSLIRLIACAALTLAAPRGGNGDTILVDDKTHHLGVAGQPEWAEFAELVPEGTALELRFESRTNTAEATVRIRQRDVKLAWPVWLNDQRIGQLVPMDSSLVHTLTVPPGKLRGGSNTLRIGPAPGIDDIFLSRVEVDTRSRREAIARAILNVSVSDLDSSQPLPARITIVDAGGALAPLWVDPASPLATRPGVVYTPDGRARLGLPPGEYTLHATRGFEYGRDTKTVTLGEGQTASVALAIRREVPTPGLVACDTHVHTSTHSGHGDASLDERVVTVAGEGIELPIATDHDHLTDLGPAAERRGVRSYFTPVIGDEVTTRAGHFNAFPFPIEARPPDPRFATWPDVLRGIKAIPGERVVILNHPRDQHAGYRPFGPSVFHEVTGRHAQGNPLGVNAVELVNSGALQSDLLGPFRDWFALLNRGEALAAVGASDSHDVTRFLVGQGRTYLAVPDDDPAQIDIAAACRALREGRALVSLGLLTDLTVANHFSVGDLASGLPDPVPVVVTVRGPSWVQVDRIELYANGTRIGDWRITPSTPAPTPIRHEYLLPRPAWDLHLVAIATGPGVSAPYWPIPRPYQPTSPVWTPRVLGATNPIYLDGDGDGRWTSPRGQAETLVKQVGTDPGRLVTTLEAYDEAVSAQAAEICHLAGVDVLDADFACRLDASTEPVRRGFASYIATLDRP
jgi:hypothetical protein